MSSTSNQIGASIGTAALSTIAAGATSSYLVTHTAASATTATVLGFTTATALGVFVLFVGALLVGLLVNADPRPDRDTPSRQRGELQADLLQVTLPATR